MADDKAEKPAPAPAQPKQNDVTRPKDGTKTGQVWAIADKLSGEGDSTVPATRGDVMKACEAAGLNQATAATQYGRWRKFHGLGRTAKAAATPDDGAEVEE